MKIEVVFPDRTVHIDHDELRVGDMPGDRVVVGSSHAARAARAYPGLLRDLEAAATDRYVVSVFGGSGVGKSEVAAVLGTLLTRDGAPAYVLSGDNYPHRIPETNDAERLRVYRIAGLQALVKQKLLTQEVTASLQQLWARGNDADSQWLVDSDVNRAYHQAGHEALDRYLGSPAEIDFADLNRVIAEFRGGESRIALKRQGRATDAIWYDEIDLSETRVLVVEWTHGNSPHVVGIDHAICLDSTPEASRAHRLKRARDANAATAFIELVIDIERSHLQGHRDSASQVIELLEPM